MDSLNGFSNFQKVCPNGLSILIAQSIANLIAW